MAIEIGSGITIGPGIVIGDKAIVAVINPFVTEDGLDNLISETGDQFIEEN